MPVDGFCLVLLTYRLYRVDIPPLLILSEISNVGQSLRKVGKVDPGSCFVFMTSSIWAAVPSNELELCKMRSCLNQSKVCERYRTNSLCTLVDLQKLFWKSAG